MSKPFVQIILVLAVVLGGSSLMAMELEAITGLSASHIHSNDVGITTSIDMSKNSYVACIPLSLREVENKIRYGSSHPLSDDLQSLFYEARFENFQLAYLVIHNTSTGLSNYSYRMANWPDKSAVTADARGGTNLSVSGQGSSKQMSFSINASASPTTDYEGYPRAQSDNGYVWAHNYNQFEGWGPSTMRFNGNNKAQILDKIENNTYMPIQRHLDVKIGAEGIGLIEGATAGGLVYYIRCKNMTREQYENPEGYTEVFEDKPLSFFGL